MAVKKVTKKPVKKVVKASKPVKASAKKAFTKSSGY